MKENAQNAAVHGEAPPPGGLPAPIVTQRGDEPVICSLVLATGLGIAHPALIKTARKYQNELSEFGRVVFENRPFGTNGGVQQMLVAYFNENQALFVGSLSRNTPKVVEFKATLVREFDRARKALAGVSQSEILKELRCLKRRMEKAELRHAAELQALRAQLPPQGSPDALPVDAMRAEVFALAVDKMKNQSGPAGKSLLWDRFWDDFERDYHIGLRTSHRRVGEHLIDVAARYGYLCRVHEFARTFFA